MENNPNPLTYHYESRLKLDYFLLGADVAILGWTIVNLGWLPLQAWFEVGIAVFWVLILISLLFGVLRQMYSSEAFGLNHLMIDAGEKIDVIEKSAMAGGPFIKQETGESITAAEFKKYASPWRDTKEKLKQRYDRVNDRTAWLGNWSFYCLIAGLCTLAFLRLIAMTYK
jgi:hypothetical protein